MRLEQRSPRVGFGPQGKNRYQDGDRSRAFWALKLRPDRLRRGAVLARDYFPEDGAVSSGGLISGITGRTAIIEVVVDDTVLIDPEIGGSA
jgi:hypothetical protein